MGGSLNSFTGNASRRCARAMTSAVLLCVVCCFAGQSAGAASKQEEKPLYLIARSSLGDPYFRHSVVLMLPISDPDLSVIIGVIVNRPTRIRLRDLFPKNAQFKDDATPAYFGGPVDVTDVSMIFRSASVPKRAIQLADGLCLTVDSGLIKKLLKNPAPNKAMRLFLGRAQWGPRQLHDEISRGAWYSIHANGSVVFNPDPERVWRTLLDQARPGTPVDYRLP
jgi:putative transcriptional regulator